MKAVLWAAGTAIVAFCVLLNGLAMCAAALSGRYPAAAFYAVTTAGCCDWVAAARRRWRSAADGYWAAGRERVR